MLVSALLNALLVGTFTVSNSAHRGADIGAGTPPNRSRRETLTDAVGQIQVCGYRRARVDSLWIGKPDGIRSERHVPFFRKSKAGSCRISLY